MIPRSFRLIDERVLSTAHTAIKGLPVDGSIEIIVRDYKPARKQSANDAMWAGLLLDIANQAWVNGRQFSADVWHEYLKKEFLPKPTDDDYFKMVTDKYKYFAEMPDGSIKYTGSTTQLTKYGMSVYMTKVTAYAAQELGVLFSANPNI